MNALEDAESEILSKAQSNGNAIYALEIDGDLIVQIGAERFAEDSRRRLTFLHALEALQKTKHVTRISRELYELTYSGWLRACAANNLQPQYGVGAIDRAKDSILVGALEQDGSINVLHQNSVLVVSTGHYSYVDNEEQRLLYLHALECLIEEEAVHVITEQFFELTYPGHVRAEELKNNGITQDKPNP